MDRASTLTWVSGTRDSMASVPSTDIGQEEIDYKSGDIMLKCKPFVHITTEPMRGRICDLCLRASSKTLRCCSDCEQIYFCAACLSSRSLSTFKAVHLLECPYLAQYGSVLSNPSKLFLRLYLRLNGHESIPYQAYTNPLTSEEVTFESLIPRIVFNSKDELVEHIQTFCEDHNLKFNQNIDNAELNKDTNTKSLNDIHLQELVSIEEIAIFQFLNLFNEFSKCDDLVEFISDDLKIYNLWTMFIRLWSHTLPISDELLTGLFTTDAIAYGLYLEPSAVVYGHSCLPNCSVVFYGPVLQLRAMQTIYSGKLLTLNFADMSIPKKERIKELRSYFISECSCSRCVVPEKIDFKSFSSSKEEFISAFIDEFSTDNKNKSLSSILNFSVKSVASEDVSKMYKDCLGMHDMCSKLYEYYEQIYPANNPEKSRFLFAFTAVEMNLLLFKLELRSEDSYQSESEPLISEQTNRLSTASSTSEFTADTKLDSLTNEINQWSELLKTTVRNIRWTHGVDHRLFREMPVPLWSIWRQARNNKSLTLFQLHSDPTILLRILCSSTRRKNGMFLNQIEQLAANFKQLIGPNAEAVVSPCCVLPSTASRYHFSHILFRTLLVLFAFLFPFIVYYTVYVEEL